MAVRPTPFQLDAQQLVAEVDAFAAFLGNDTNELSERSEILPFFKKHQHLASLVGFNHSRTFHANLIKSELGLFGDFACDLAVGSSDLNEFCFVEFENAAPDKIGRAHV